MLVQSGWGFLDGRFRTSLRTSALWNTLWETIFSHVSISFFLIRFLNLLFIFSAPSHGGCSWPFFLSPQPQIPEWNFGIWSCMWWEWNILLFEFGAGVEPNTSSATRKPARYFHERRWHPVPGSKARGSVRGQWVPFVSPLHLCSSSHPLGPDTGGPWPREAVAFTALHMAHPSLLQLGFEAQPWYLSQPLVSGRERWAVTRLIHLECPARPRYGTWSTRGAVYLRLKTRLDCVPGMDWASVHSVSVPGMLLPLMAHGSLRMELGAVSPSGFSPPLPFSFYF